MTDLKEITSVKQRYGIIGNSEAMNRAISLLIIQPCTILNDIVCRIIAVDKHKSGTHFHIDPCCSINFFLTDTHIFMVAHAATSKS